MQLFDEGKGGGDYNGGEDLQFISETLLDHIVDIEETKSMLKSLVEKSGSEAMMHTVFDYLDYAIGALINAEHDLTDTNFSINAGEIKDYRWEPMYGSKKD